jgi:flagella basal body P-ring formation protein FlgA
VEAAGEVSPYLTSFDGVRGKVAARELRAGAMLTLRSISDPAVVYGGDPINLVAVNGRVQVATRAVALQDGAVGDRIAVRNLASNKVVQAAVHGPGLAVIELQLPQQGRQP